MKMEEVVRLTGYILIAAISIIVSLFLTANLLRMYEIKMQERLADIYEKLLYISRKSGQADLGKRSPEHSDLSGGR